MIVEYLLEYLFFNFEHPAVINVLFDTISLWLLFKQLHFYCA